ncbi:type III PLP-dependent enzyme [Paenibacillus alkalitolerans]|uniref:type III PLP-dependent enzyme n=1 Tax=Paenibacillus alkalitolerans TaxID=2799335 RepID=UPI0018F645C1|nr:type III PLP-dependent enzyme [Paenibacillus alkalitolerans]
MNRIIEQIALLKENHRRPLCAYIYDMEHLSEHVSRRVRTLPPSCRLFYAIKANSEEEILRALLPVVEGFEVASLGEVKKVRAVSRDIPIIFGGPGKTDEEIEGAMDNRVSLIHAESADEVRRIAWIAAQRGKVMPILLRVNLQGPLPDATLAMAGRPTQFGIDESQIPDAIRLAQSLDSVKLEGFHFHSLSNNLDAEKHVRLVQYYCERTAAWIEEFGLEDISYLNAGGGIGVNYAEPEAQFDWDLLVERLGPALKEKCPPNVTVLFECGRYVAASCGYYAAEVLDIKQNHGKNYVILRGGTHHFRLPVSWQMSHPFRVVPVERWDYPFPRRELNDAEITVVGQLCTPKDVLAKDVPVSGVRVGDVILFLLAGAYGWAISHHDFLSHPHPDHIYL